MLSGTTTEVAGSADGAFDMPNSSVTCTYTNTRTQNQVELEKVWVNGLAGDTAALTITGGVTNPATATSTAPDAPAAGNTASTPALSGAPVTVAEEFTGTGSYTSVLECVETGTSTAVPGSADGTFPMPNTPVTCTFTNTRTQNLLELEKVWVNGLAGDTAALTITGGVTDPATATSTAPAVPAAGNTASTLALSGAPVTVAEELTGTGSYTSVLECVETGTSTAVPGSADGAFPMPNSSVTCTYTNTRTQNLLELEKVWVNGLAGDTADLTITGGLTNPATATSTAPDAPAAGNTASTPALSGAPVTVAEELTGTGSYTSVLECVETGTSTAVPGSADGAFPMPNTPVTCTYTNTRTQNLLELEKVWVNGLAGDTADLTITGGVTDPATATSTAPDAPAAGNTASTPALSGAPVTVAEELTGTGSYTSVLECVETGTSTAVPGSADGAFPMPNSSVTCTYTNTRTQNLLELEKVWVNGLAGDTADLTITGGLTNPATATSTAPDAPAAGNTASTPALSGAPVTVAEELTGTGSYTSVLECVETGTSTAVPGSADGAFPMPNSSVTCTYTNTRTQNLLELEKVWVNGLAGDQADLTITGGVTDPATATSTAPAVPAAGNTASTLALSGAPVTVAEELTGTGSYTPTLQCVLTGTTTEVPGSADGIFPMPNSPVVCTFTNSRPQHLVTLSKIWVDGFAGDTADLSITGGIEGSGVATSTATGASGEVPDTTSVAAVVAVTGDTIGVGEALGASNNGAYDSSAVTCTDSEGGQVSVIDGEFVMPDADVNCSVTNARAVQEPMPPTVTPAVCDPADATATVPGSITIPENPDYDYFIDGLPYGPGTYPLAAGRYTVTAQLRGLAPDGAELVRPLAEATHTSTLTVDAAPVCPELDKTADPPSGTEVEQGDVITYTITVQNVGTDAVVDETVVDTLPEGVELIESSVDPEADFDEAEGTLTWTIDLPAGSGGEPSRLVLTYQVEVTTDEGTLMNEARWVERDLTAQTSHPVNPPPTEPTEPPLPPTGAGNVSDMAVAGLLLLSGGALVTLGVRRRRREE